MKFNKEKKNILIKYIILSLITILTVRYVPIGKLQFDEVITITSIISVTMLLLDINLPIVYINYNE